MAKIDKSNMRGDILNFPKQFTEGFDIAKNTGENFAGKKFTNIVVAGMGGSALPGDLLQTFTKDINLKIPLYVHRDYNLPIHAGPDSLVVVISYSGNTEEALSAYETAQKIGSRIAVITSGGNLEEFAQKDKVPYIIIPSGVQPRLGIGYQFSALLALLQNAGLIDAQNIKMHALENTLDAERFERQGKELAEQLQNTTPLIYGSDKYRTVVYIIKKQINENAKMHAFSNVLPELNHNEMIAFENENKKFSVLMLQDNDDTAMIKKRIKLTGQIIEARGYPVYEVDIKGKNLYNKVFNIILLGNWISYYLAINRNVDPSPVKIIEEFKRKL